MRRDSTTTRRLGELRVCPTRVGETCVRWTSAASEEHGARDNSSKEIRREEAEGIYGRKSYQRPEASL